VDVALTTLGSTSGELADVGEHFHAERLRTFVFFVPSW
jgi:hypothetical protein